MRLNREPFSCPSLLLKNPSQRKKNLLRAIIVIITGSLRSKLKDAADFSRRCFCGRLSATSLPFSSTSLPYQNPSLQTAVFFSRSGVVVLRLLLKFALQEFRRGMTTIIHS